MGIFKLFKKKSKTPKDLSKSENLEDITNTLLKNNMISVPKDDNHNTFGGSLDKLVDGDLPWGWVAHKKDFIEPIEKEYSYFLQSWLDARNGSPKELYSALKSFVRYMEDVKRLCSSKGKNFECWCNTILIKDEYFNIRKEELEDLSTKWAEMQKEYELKQKLLSTLPDDLMDFLNDNNGILQSDVYKHFRPVVKSEIQSLLYEWGETGKIKKEKSGRSYKITV